LCPANRCKRFLKMLITFCQTIQLHISEGSNVHIHCYENLKCQVQLSSWGLFEN
jgi:hypothetical protein